MEVNRLNPTKSIRIGGISHFAFVNGWLLRGWGRSCIAGNTTKARSSSRCPAVAVGTHCSCHSAVAVGARLSQGGRRLICGYNGSPRAELWGGADSHPNAYHRNVRGFLGIVVTCVFRRIWRRCGDRSFDNWRRCGDRPIAKTKKLSAFATFLRLGTPVCFPARQKWAFSWLIFCVFGPESAF